MKILFNKAPSFLTVHAQNIPLPSYCQRFKELFAISNVVKDDVINRYSGKYNVKTIPNGIRMDDILRKEDYGFANSTMQVVQVGSVVASIKGQDLLIEALSLLKQRGVLSIEISFIGEPYEIESLATEAKRLEVDDRVHFIGLKSRDYIYQHLRDFDLMCHPSREEGFGLTVAEGIAAGLPVLVPDADGPFEIIRYGELGYTFKKGNAYSLADALQDIYKHYQERRIKVVDAAYDYIKNTYSLHHMVELYLEEYKTYAR